MRLIDADAFLVNNKELADCDFIHPKYCDTLRDLVNNAPTVDVLEQIRDEITHLLNRPSLTHVVGYDKGFVDGIDKVLQIIDKYKAESVE